MNANNKIIINTIVMYIRYIVTMVITLFSSRWILLALGVEDFGLYSIIAGILSMLMFLNVTLASSSQRFLSFAAGKNDINEQRRVFYICALLHFILGFIIVIIIDTIGLYFLNNVLNIPSDRLGVARIVMFSLSVSSFFTVITVPYYATLFAHENIVFISIVQVSESLLKLFSAYYLLFYHGDRLILYSIFMVLIPIVASFSFVIFCTMKYTETHFLHVRLKGSSMKPFLLYSSWNLIGGISTLIKTQGIAVLLNAFLGVVVNAAYGIAIQVNSQLRFFSNAILQAAKPQIVKSEGAGNRMRMLQLSRTTSKIMFLLMAIISIPLIIEMPYILELWLKDVPKYTINFTRIIILSNCVSQLSWGLILPIESVGNIRSLQIYVGGFHFVVLPIAYLFLYLNFQPELVLMVALVEEIACVVIELAIFERVINQNPFSILFRDIVPCLFLFVGVLFILYYFTSFHPENLYRLIEVSAITLILVSSVSFFILTEKEKSFMLQFVSSFINKIKYKRR